MRKGSLKNKRIRSFQDKVEIIPSDEKRSFFRLNSKSKLDLLLKLLSVAIMCAGFYGFAYQKGMVSEMGLENVDFNYEIKEIYFFTLLGVAQIVKNLTEISIIPDVNQIFFMAGIFLFLGLIVYFSVFKRDLKIKNIKKWIFHFL